MGVKYSKLIVEEEDLLLLLRLLQLMMIQLWLMLLRLLLVLWLLRLAFGPQPKNVNLGNYILILRKSQ